jgi:hypothetical protein
MYLLNTAILFSPCTIEMAEKHATLNALLSKLGLEALKEACDPRLAATRCWWPKNIRPQTCIVVSSESCFGGAVLARAWQDETWHCYVIFKNAGRDARFNFPISKLESASYVQLRKSASESATLYQYRLW